MKQVASLIFILSFSSLLGYSQSGEFSKEVTDILSLKLDSASVAKLAIATSENGSEGLGLIVLGVEHEVNHKPELARAAWLNAIDAYENSGAGTMWANYLIATSHMAMRETDQALPYSERSEAFAKENNRPHIEGMHWIALSVAQRINNDHEASFASARKALKIFSAAKL